jgi:DnaK suppressor protein
MPKTTQAKIRQAKTRRMATPGPQDLHRTDTLRRGLLERRRELQNELYNRMRDGRARRTQEGTDDLEHSEADIQDHLTLALLQMRSEALVQIDAALARLDAGGYGLCAECEREITTRRLRALPFAVRCQPCEETRERTHRDARRLAQGRGSLGRFPEMARA